jgi:hypothetical protein
MAAAAPKTEQEEAAYYQTIEEFFVSRRGDPLFLSNADWLLIRKWRLAGLPLRVALRGIGDALDGHAHSWGRKRKVGSLAYCAAEVDAARDRWQRALSFDGEEEESVSTAVAAFAAALGAATGLGPCGAVAARAAAEELRSWVGPASSGARRLEDLTLRLAALEKTLVAALRSETDAPAISEIQSAIDADLTPYAGRMPAKVLQQIRDEAWTRRLLARHGIPRLSVFHL